MEVMRIYGRSGGLPLRVSDPFGGFPRLGQRLISRALVWRNPIYSMGSARGRGANSLPCSPDDPQATTVKAHIIVQPAVDDVPAAKPRVECRPLKAWNRCTQPVIRPDVFTFYRIRDVHAYLPRPTASSGKSRRPLKLRGFWRTLRPSANRREKRS